MSEETSPQDIQLILDENSNLIKSILSLQAQGKIMEVLIFQARLQSNLTRIQKLQEKMNSETTQMSNTRYNNSSIPINAQLTKFVNIIQKVGVKNISVVSQALDIPPEKVVKLSLAYVAYLRRQNRVSEAQQILNELEINGISQKDE